MSSLTERDRLVRENWRDPRFVVPDPHPDGPHFPVEAIGVIKDDKFLRGKETVETVYWWPAARKWTATYQAHTEEEVQEYPVTVTHWQPPLKLPWE